ncbi:hypothetical protein [Streptomyces sp. BH055]|uniref:hypothetical protein n=1 Tax=unclassified Streptomyces TaxID=2593676 RepID=UPI003BB73535
MTDTAAWERHRERRSYVYRRARGWIIGGVLIVFALRCVWGLGGWVDWNVTPAAGTGESGRFRISSCAPAGGGDYRCAGKFRLDSTGEVTYDTAFVSDTYEDKGALAFLYRTQGGGYAYENPGKVTASQLGGAAAGLGGVSFMLAAGIFFLVTGYTPRPPRFSGNWSRWGRVGLAEAWGTLRSRTPALWSFVIFAALCPLLLGVGLLVVFVA